MAPRHIESIEALKGLIGEHLGYSEYMDVSQERVNEFAEATGDFQWIHIDVEKANAGPFGGPIAHGYLTLSLGPVLLPQAFTVGGIAMGVNYGANKVRFIAPVKWALRFVLASSFLQLKTQLVAHASPSRPPSSAKALQSLRALRKLSTSTSPAN
jgi:hypothetical protein